MTRLFTQSQLTMAALAGFGAIVFALDAWTITDGTTAVLYCAVFVAAPGRWRRKNLICTAIACAAVTAASYLVAHGAVMQTDALVRHAISIGAIGGMALLEWQSLVKSEAVEVQTQLLQLTDDAIIVTCPAGMVKFWNPGAAALYGWQAHDITGEKVENLLQLVAEPSVFNILAAMQRDGSWQGEVQLARDDGTRSFVMSRWVYHRDDEGRIIGIISTGWDVTRKREDMRLLMRNEERYHNIFHTAGVGILEIDCTSLKQSFDGLRAQGVANRRQYALDHPEFLKLCGQAIRILDVNDSAWRIFETDSRARFLELCNVSDAAPRYELVREIVLVLTQETRLCSTEVELSSFSGRPIWVSLSAKLPAGIANTSQLAIIVTDITQQKQAQEALIAAEKRLAQIVQLSSLGEMTAAIAHEVNQPLAAAVMNAGAALNWMRNAPPDRAQAREAAQSIVENGRRAGLIAARIRNLAGQLPVAAEAFSVRQVAGEACALLEYEARLYKVNLEICNATALPESVGDRIQILQVLVNLLTNAMQSMAALPAGPRRIRIILESYDARSNILRVEGAGAGISEAVFSRLFQPFFTTKPDGIGLGLFICKMIVEAHGGKIWADRLGDTGMAVQFTLPVATPLPVASGGEEFAKTHI